MNLANIIELLQENGLTEIEEIKVDDEKCILECFYDFDREEIEGAKAYANEESDLEEDSDEWRTDYYIPYLLDIAKDNVESIVDDIGDDLELTGKSQELEIDANTLDYIKFRIAFCVDEFEGDLESLLNDYLN
ncbi:MAG: hypothetical protein ACRDAU_01610 [Clostridium sp.]